MKTRKYLSNNFRGSDLMYFCNARHMERCKDCIYSDTCIRETDIIIDTIARFLISNDFIPSNFARQDIIYLLISYTNYDVVYFFRSHHLYDPLYFRILKLKESFND